MELEKRTIIRSITYRLGATAILVGATWITTGNMLQTSTISITFAIISSLFYYLHERAWLKTSWGTKSWK